MTVGKLTIALLDGKLSCHNGGVRVRGSVMKMKLLCSSILLLGLIPLGLHAQESSLVVESSPVIENEQIDAKTFLEHITVSHERRSKRILTEEQFIEMAQDPDTVVLDARSAERYAQMHIQGAQSLSFTEFTAETLANVIPSKDTRVLIYCNNNIINSPIAFATKSPPASLNLSTYTSLHTYGYQNVYELGPIVDPKTSKLKFSGTLVSAQP